MSGGFSSLGLMDELVTTVESDFGWIRPTDIQDEAIPLILGGGDVMAAAETGSGKTAAFALPVIQCVYERLTAKMSGSRSKMRLSSSDRDTTLDITDSEGLSVASTGPTVWSGVRADAGVKKGKHYFECYITGTGISRVGWSTMSAQLELGKDPHGVGYGGKGFLSVNGTYEKYGGEFGKGDCVGCYLDLDGKVVSFSKNGTHLGDAAPIPGQIGSVFFPAVLLQNSSLTVNFGDQSFLHPPSLSGFSAVSKASPLVSSDSSEAYRVEGRRKPLAIVIEPTKDLAEQVHQTFVDLLRHVSHPSLNCSLLIGDGGNNNNKSEQADIVVGTMGKLQHLVKSGLLDLSCIRFFILDEADKLLSSDSLSSILSIFSHCPGGGTGNNRLQVCFFSATLHSPAITELANRICVNPIWVDLKGFEAVPECVHHVVYLVEPVGKDSNLLAIPVNSSATDQVHMIPVPANRADEKASQEVKEMKLLLLTKILDKFKMTRCIVFCRTNLDCDNLQKFLNNLKDGKLTYSSSILAGMKSMESRRDSLAKFKEGSVRLLICTDVAARGIDIEGFHPFYFCFK